MTKYAFFETDHRALFRDCANVDIVNKIKKVSIRFQF